MSFRDTRDWVTFELVFSDEKFITAEIIFITVLAKKYFKNKKDISLKLKWENLKIQMQHPVYFNTKKQRMKLQLQVSCNTYYT